jgi:hypothetical protein
VSGSGSGDVTASANILDNAIVRGDGGSKGVQQSSILIDDSDNITGVENISYSQATAGVTSLGNLGTTEAVDFSGDTVQYGTLDNDVTITFTNESDGLSVTLLLIYDGSAQRTITWSDVDVWLNDVAPAAPTSSSDPLIVNLIRINSVTYGSHNKISSSIDHGTLSGLTDDDHTQYSLISSGAGVPSTTPGRVGEIYIDTTADNVYISTDTSSSADWDQATGAGGGSLSDVVDDTTPQLGGNLDAQTNYIENLDEVEFTEKADHTSTPAAGNGILWVKNTSPSTLIFTDDAGTDSTLGSGGTSDHGALTGLGDDDHTQYTIISSGAGSPGSTPTRIGAIYIDTTNNRTFFAFGTTDYNDWRYTDTTANPFVPSVGAQIQKTDETTDITKSDGTTDINKTG